MTYDPTTETRQAGTTSATGSAARPQEVDVATGQVVTPTWREPSRTGPSRRIAGQRQLWLIGGEYYLVWMTPVDADGDGEFDETLPIAFRGEQADLRNAGIALTPTQTLSTAEFDALGGLTMGNVLELNNPDQDPFAYMVESLQAEADLYPWLLEPEVMAYHAAALLRGEGGISNEDLMRTDWWKSRTPEEREWASLVTTDPAKAEQMLRDNRIITLQMLEDAGVNNAPDELVNLLADSLTRGEWSEVYLSNQVALLADPTKRGVMDQTVTDYFAGEDAPTLDTTASRRDVVEATVKRWLGPTFGNWTQSQYEEWAGKLRNDPDALQSLEAMLSQQRLAMFPTYADATLTYEDISAPWRGLFTQTWGEIPDETDPFFNRIVNLNDSFEAEKLLLREGLDRGIRTVSERALRDLADAVSRNGTQVVRAQ